MVLQVVSIHYCAAEKSKSLFIIGQNVAVTVDLAGIGKLNN